MGESVAMGTAARKLERIYRAHAPRVRWVARARGVPEHAVDDVVHDAFLTIYRRIDERDPDVSDAAWVMSVARNVAFSHRRSAARRAQRVSQIPEPPPTPTPHDELERRDAWRALSEFLDGLDDDQREAFVLCEIMQTPAPEVAATTDVKLNTVYSRVRIARRRFEQHFADKDPDSQALLRLAQRQESPSPARQRQTLSALALDLGLGAVAPSAVVATGAGIAGAWKIAAAASLVGVASLVAVRMATEPNDSPTSTARAQVAASANGERPTSVPDALPPTEVSADVEPAQVEPTLAAVPVKKPRPPRVAHAADAATPTKAAANEDPLTAEVQLLTRAQAHLTGGRPRKALDAVEKYAAEFPAGALVRQRHSIERDAACQLGDDRRARKAATALGDADFDGDCTVEEKGPQTVTEAAPRGAE